MRINVVGSIVLLVCFCSTLRAQSNRDSLVSLETVMQEISAQRYGDLLEQFLTSKQESDTVDRLKALGLIERTTCKEICETYLIDSLSGEMILLPSDFDAGVLGTMFSPSGAHFVVYSSYDGPDYDAYYMHRAAFHVYRIAKQEHSLKALGMNASYALSVWSIEELVWVDDSRIALKLYEGQRGEVELNGEYNYFEVRIP